jgi:uncharacterized protein
VQSYLKYAGQKEEWHRYSKAEKGAHRNELYKQKHVYEAVIHFQKESVIFLINRFAALTVNLILDTESKAIDCQK